MFPKNEKLNFGNRPIFFEEWSFLKFSKFSTANMETEFLVWTLLLTFFIPSIRKILKVVLKSLDKLMFTKLTWIILI